MNKGQSRAKAEMLGLQQLIVVAAGAAVATAGVAAAVTAGAAADAVVAAAAAVVLMAMKVMQVVRDTLRPEFFNRIDEFVVFESLTKPQIKEVVRMQLERVADRLMEKKVKLKVDDSALSHLTEVGYDAAYGARPLKRLIQRLVETRIAQQLLEGSLEENDMVTVKSSNNTLLFEVQSAKTGKVKVFPSNPTSSNTPATPATAATTIAAEPSASPTLEAAKPTAPPHNALSPS
ncbi:hypothetical protein Esti_006819 [Eimeria stiedai]